MDPPEVGVRCEYSSCSLLDFLPVKCFACHKTFCKDHYSVDAHSCTEIIDNNDITYSERAVRCTLSDCALPTEGPEGIVHEGDKASVTCPHCSLQFCLKHRFPSSHGCACLKQESSSSRNMEAKTLLSKHFPERYTADKSIPSRPVKVYEKTEKTLKVRMMKIRQSAVPGDPKLRHSSVQISERVHVQVIFNELKTPKIFWFTKTISIGRALDLLQTHFKASSRQSWVLLKVSETSENHVQLAFDKPLGEEVEDGSVLFLREAPE